MRVRSQLLAVLLCAAALILVGWAYLPGLSGDFLFDDYANLPALGATGPVTSWATFLRYITSGLADPIGRPLTLLTFLVDGHDWPTRALPFKRTNLIIHLFNGVLLAWLLTRLGSYLQHHPVAWKRRVAAVFAAAIWMLHPLFVSTVLYVVQREAMLPATFALVGMLGWLYGRERLFSGRRVSGTAMLAVSVIACTLLGMLAKANGLLLPVLIAILETTLLRNARDAPPGQARIWRPLCLCLLVFPTACILGYLTYQGYWGIAHGIARPWTLAQRLLTEPRVVLTYLDLLWVPRPFTSGVFNDQIVASTGWLHPATTLAAAISVAFLLILAFAMRRRAPAASLAILFYFGGQLLESTTIGLELYYEHRNYLPAMLMFWPLALFLCGSKQTDFIRPAWLSLPSANVWRSLSMLTSVIVLAGLATMLHEHATLWGDNRTRAVLWAQLNPDSPRAQANAAGEEIASGRSQDAYNRLERISPAHPFDPQITMNILSARCDLGGLDQATKLRAVSTMANMALGEQVIFGWLERAMDTLDAPHCPGLDAPFIEQLIDAASQNPILTKVHGPRQDLLYLRGRMSLVRRNPEEALSWFNKAIEVSARPETAFAQAALLGNAGFPHQALAHLRFYEQQPVRQPSPTQGMPWIHAWVLREQNYWPNELNRLRATLREDQLRKHS